MDLQRMERLTRDVIGEYGFPCDVVTVRESGSHWTVTVRLQARHVVEFEIPKGTPAQTRQRLVERLDEACPGFLKDL
jgi:hypothetical protein